MKQLIVFCSLAALGGCALSTEGVSMSPPPPAVQGSNDVQGAPLSVPGAGMGVGSGSPAGTGVPAGAPAR